MGFLNFLLWVLILGDSLIWVQFFDGIVVKRIWWVCKVRLRI